MLTNDVITMAYGFVQLLIKSQAPPSCSCTSLHTLTMISNPSLPLLFALSISQSVLAQTVVRRRRRSWGGIIAGIVVGESFQFQARCKKSDGSLRSYCSLPCDDPTMLPDGPPPSKNARCDRPCDTWRRNWEAALRWREYQLESIRK